VSSSSLCKKFEGAVSPIFVEAMEDGIDDPVEAWDVGEDHHGPSAASHFHEAAFNHVGGAQFLPQVLREGVEVEQVGQILLQASDQLGIGGLPGALKIAKGLSGLGQAGGLIDFLRVLLDPVMIASAHGVGDIAHFVHPAALMRHARVDRLEGGGQACTAIGDDQLQMPAPQPALIEVLQGPFPPRLALTPRPHKPQQLTLPVGPDAVSHQQQDPLWPKAPAHLDPHPIQEEVGPIVS
jgi:hypothetical protein